MQIRFIPCLIFHNYKSAKSAGWVGMAEGGGNIEKNLKIGDPKWKRPL